MKKNLSFILDTRPDILLENVSHLGKSFLDCRYAFVSPYNTFDLFLPDMGKTPYPLIIYIHTGAFAYGSKRDQDILPVLAALSRGYAVASIDYRRSTEVNWPAQIYDAKAAVRFLRSRAAEYNLDPNRFAVWGIAAGGYLGSMLGVTSKTSLFDDFSMGCPDVSSSVHAVVEWCSICGTLFLLDDQITENGFGNPIHSAAASAESVMMGNPLDEIHELCRLASPCTYVRSDIPPFLIVHGKKDPVVPYQQSLEFAEAIRKAAPDKVQLLLLDQVAHHGDPWYASEAASTTALDFLDSVLHIS